MRNITLLFLFFPLVTLSQIINKTLFFDGLEREYIVYVPDNYDGTSDVPLLFCFHGGSGYANEFLQMVNMNAIADTAGFIVIYPQGAFDYGALEQGQDSSFAYTSWLHKSPTTHNDVNFIDALIDTLNSQYLVDLNRVYACGYSEGGIFTYELGCRLNNKIAAFASVSGSMLTESFREDYGFGLCLPTHPTAVMLIPGTDDENFHSVYDGFEPYYLSVENITNYWSSYNNTNTDPTTLAIFDSNSNDNSNVERREWSDGDNCVSVVELKVIGGGHDWPGSFGNMDISASQEIWKFISRYDLNGLIDCNSTGVEFNTIVKSNKPRKIVNVLGEKSKEIRNKLLFYIFDDGTVERKIIIE